MWSRRSVDLFSSRKPSAVRTKANAAPANVKSTSQAKMSAKPSTSRPLTESWAQSARSSMRDARKDFEEVSARSMKYVNLGVAALVVDVIGVWLMTLLQDDGV